MEGSPYFDRRPYVEADAAGRVVYAEYHRTVGDHVREVAAAGLTLVDLVEPEWPGWNDQVWGGWGPERGRYLPGTATSARHSSPSTGRPTRRTSLPWSTDTPRRTRRWARRSCTSRASRSTHCERAHRDNDINHHEPPLRRGVPPMSESVNLPALGESAT